MFHITGDTIYYDGQAVAWLTIPNGTLRQQVTEALDDLPTVAPIVEALALVQESEDPAKTLHLTADLVKHVEAWLESLKDTNTGALL